MALGSAHLYSSLPAGLTEAQRTAASTDISIEMKEPDVQRTTTKTRRCNGEWKLITYTLVLHILKRRSTNPVLSLLVKISSELPLGQSVILVQKGHLIFPSTILFCLRKKNDIINLNDGLGRAHLYTSFTNVVVAVEKFGLMLSASQYFKTSVAENSLDNSPLGRRRAGGHLRLGLFTNDPPTHRICTHIDFPSFT